MYSDRIKGNSAEIIAELSRAEAVSIIQKSIRTLSFSTGEDTEKLKDDGPISDMTQDQKEILDAYEKTNRSHEEILRFMLGEEEK